MKIKITQSGWETYTGHLGTVEFANGVSVSEVSERDAGAIAAIVQAETLEGLNPSPAQKIIDARITPMDATAADVVVDLKTLTGPTNARVWTRAELEAVADADGIKGLREIATPLGLKANGTADLIDKIMQANPVDGGAAPAPVETPAAE